MDTTLVAIRMHSLSMSQPMCRYHHCFHVLIPRHPDAQVPDMAGLFMAECQTLCPYTIPMFIDPTAAKSAEEYKLSIGYAA